MNNFNWQSFLRDNSELFKYKQEVKFPASDYNIDKNATDLDVKEITRICNHALIDFLKKQAKTGDDEPRSTMIKPDTDGVVNKEIKPKENESANEAEISERNTGNEKNCPDVEV